MNKVTSTVTYGNNETNLDDWQQSANPWTVTLRYKRKQMTVNFWTGSALGEPETDDVLYCLLADASGLENSQSFDDWASDYGYDTDSRKAEKTYNAVKSQTEKLKNLLGDDFNSFIYLDEDQVKSIAA